MAINHVKRLVIQLKKYSALTSKTEPGNTVKFYLNVCNVNDISGLGQTIRVVAQGKMTWTPFVTLNNSAT